MPNKSRRAKPGPFSRDQALADLDGRTRAARVLKSVQRELMDHIGDASAPQRLIIQSAALKACRLALLTEQLLTGAAPAESSDAHALAWLNSMRMDLQALGLERKKIQTLELNEYMRQQAQAEAAAA